jgi:hypothetical protein
MVERPELVTMSTKEIDRLEVIRRVVERGLKRVKAAQAGTAYRPGGVDSPFGTCAPPAYGRSA